MEPLIRRAADRGHFDHGWLKTWHTFSFGDYYDEAWMGFRSLRVMNEDIIAPGKGFDLHPHRDMEILTYVMSGALRHVDTMGNNDVLKAGEFQLMTAGAGVQHMELNASQTEDCHLYQIWILPNERDLEPGYKNLVVPSAAEGPLRKVLIASPDARDGSLKIHQDAEVWLYRLQAGETAKINVPDGKAVWMQIVSGEIEIGGERLASSDAVGFDAVSDVVAKSEAEIILFLL